MQGVRILASTLGKELFDKSIEKHFREEGILFVLSYGHEFKREVRTIGSYRFLQYTQGLSYLKVRLNASIRI